MSVSHSDCLPLSDSNPAPPVSRPLPKRVVFVGLPTSPSSNVKVTGERIRKPPRPARPPPLLILVPPGCGNRGTLQGDSPETAIPVNLPPPPSSRVTSGRIRKPSLPMRPPPVVLRPKRLVRKPQKIHSRTLAKSGTITFTDEGNRGSPGSMLPNPWDSGAKPIYATFESPILQRPSFTESARRANALKAGGPRTPRETRIFKFMPPELPRSEIGRSYPENG